MKIQYIPQSEKIMIYITNEETKIAMFVLEANILGRKKRKSFF